MICIPLGADSWATSWAYGASYRGQNGYPERDVNDVVWF